MSAAFSLHLALDLVPYLDPTDIARARRVCKVWCAIFSSGALAQVALRTHFPLCLEVLSPSRPLDYGILNRISRRHAALKSGVPRQELRIPMTSGHRGTCIWTFAENLLVLQSSYFPLDVLSLIYLDARSDPRRIVNGELVLAFSEGIVAKIKVCRSMLVVERVFCRTAVEWSCRVDCFRVSLAPGNSEVIATKVSGFTTFEFNFDEYADRTNSDHSGKYYVVYSGILTPSKGKLQIWDIETGEMIRRIPALEFPKICNVTNVLVVAKNGPDGPQQVVVAGMNSNYRGEHLWPAGIPRPLGRDRVTDFKVFPVEAGLPGWTGCITYEEKQGRSPPVNFDYPLVICRKVPRYPADITSPDTPGDPGYLAEEAGLTFWHRDSDAGDVCSSYHSIPDHPPASASDEPLAVERELRTASKGNPWGSDITVDSRSGISLAMDVVTRKGDFEEDEPYARQLRVRGFYPSATPGVMALDWETCLKSSEDKGKTREIIGGENGEDFDWGFLPFMVIDESELATAFMDMSSGTMEIVVVLWDERFHGELPLGGKVLG